MKKKVLFLPFLQIPSGHHQAANALLEGILQINPNIKCDTVDILAYSYGKMESIVSKIYLNWIHSYPSLYNFIYRNSVYRNREKNKRYWTYELLFLSFMKKLIKEKQPDLIVCTHALPAYMLNYLKAKKELRVPVMNVYTDYFIHRFWGVEHIDFHFVSSQPMKEFLNKKGVSDDQIFMTGIPIHPKIKKEKYTKGASIQSKLSVLISGGNLGVGAIEELVQQINGAEPCKQIQFYILCGKNKKLFEKINGLQKSFLIPFSYIDCREKMNELYDQIDGIITKPGGVTISESLFKRKPIFIFNALPGQEEINLQQLTEMGLVYHLNKQEVQRQVLAILQDQNEMKQYQMKVESFHSKIQSKEPSEIIANLLST
ncbi:MGDG synthase family glycosyltransferase [Cytobacillus dafuensis]|uniref:UDP-glucuronosyltransferase n=1 Tax=Cytobacillus dafuensis TaxID=1742359 RepID=A0A5B8Z901_CYTDA|nr:glycosyltransferase [Cytobacillus dafuensis]QED49361.1 UDP-glucuronosyltransferase [Cytobacillus dafuensis]